MKKFIVFSLMIIFSITAFSQSTGSTKIALTKEDYLNKSKKQKNVAWIFLGGGAAVLITGAVIPRGDLTDQFDPWTWKKDIYENDGLKAGFMLTGSLSMLTSIPFFIASGKNKRRALSMSFKFQQVPQSQKEYFVKRQVPSLSLKFNL